MQPKWEVVKEGLICDENWAKYSYDSTATRPQKKTIFCIIVFPCPGQFENLHCAMTCNGLATLSEIGHEIESSELVQVVKRTPDSTTAKKSSIEINKS